MAKKFAQGIYNPKNPKKYVGSVTPTYRSSWEKRVFIWLDQNPNVISWASEPVKIPYMNPLTNRPANYIPDLLVKSIDKLGKEHIEMIEIKPLKETLAESAKSKRDQIALAINLAKWKQAAAWCKGHGIKFRIMNETHIFGV